ncbi:efflux transporter outer membrane subunit, partial [Myxococcota bacterium]|nr:efflux transporter outer membrane subunit [Myxococcota bacterium]
MKLERFVVAGLVAALTISGCAVGPNYRAPEERAPDEFRPAARAGLYASSEIEPAWWNQFGDPLLVELVQDAIRGNLDLRIALANLNEARAIRFQTALTLLPIVPLNTDYTREKLSEAQLRGAPGGRGFDFFETGFDATWELDLFGRIRRQVESATGVIERQQAILDDVVVSVVAEVGRTYFELRGRQNELAVARRNAENQEQTYDLTLALLEEGRGTQLDVSRAKAQLDSTRSLIPPLETTIRVDIHRLSVLTGRLPTELLDRLDAPQPIPIAPSEIAIGDPGELLRRRPDIRAAERNLASVTAQIGVATADLFPRVTFIGSIGVNASDTADLFSHGSDTYSFGPRIAWAAFDLGRVYQRIRQADARNAAALASYESTVLKAFEETENALVAYGNLLRETESLNDAAAASEEAVELARLRYEDGASS